MSVIAADVVADITRMLVKQNITTPLFAALSGGGSGGGWLGGLMASIFYEGGIVGDPAPKRAVSAHVFAGAPRYHRGGIAGLKPDEVSAILRRVEEVVSRKDRQRRATSVNVVMNVATPDANSFHASQGQIAAAAARGINRAKRNM